MENEKGRKIFASRKTSLKDSLVEFCENLVFAEVAMVPLPFLFFLKESTIEMLDMLSKKVLDSLFCKYVDSRPRCLSNLYYKLIQPSYEMS